jgi:hypothetical protein
VKGHIESHWDRTFEIGADFGGFWDAKLLYMGNRVSIGIPRPLLISLGE